MAGVQRLQGPVRVPVAKHSRGLKPPLGVPSERAGQVGEAAGALLEVETLGESVVGRAPDVNRKLVKELKQGEPAPQATLDLHGRTAAVAKDLLTRFVASSLAAGRTSVLVIHGRGHHSAADGPVIKTLVVQVLSSRPLCGQILAFASAPRALGGEGALMVRLRRPR